jgi:hypothetical protein
MQEPELPAAAAGEGLAGLSYWWKAEWLLSGRRVAIADIGQLPAFSKRMVKRESLQPLETRLCREKEKWPAPASGYDDKPVVSR